MSMTMMRGLAACLALSAVVVSADTGRAQPAPCRSVTHEAAAYTVCEVDLRRHDVRLFLDNAAGEPYSYLRAIPEVDARSNKPLLFSTNGGMFHPDYRPVGLFVQGGRTLRPISTRAGPGNFHLRPNGVFYMARGAAGVLETQAYIKARIQPEFATQSGPMLVVDGKLHPKFVSAEASKKARNGVGVRDPQTIVFAISDDAVSFASFARLYRDVLKCPNALFLDGGSVPALYAPSLNRGSNLRPMGPILGIYAK